MARRSIIGPDGAPAPAGAAASPPDRPLFSSGSVALSPGIPGRATVGSTRSTRLAAGKAGDDLDLLVVPPAGLDLPRLLVVQIDHGLPGDLEDRLQRHGDDVGDPLDHDLARGGHAGLQTLVVVEDRRLDVEDVDPRVLVLAPGQGPLALDLPGEGPVGNGVERDDDRPAPARRGRRRPPRPWPSRIISPRSGRSTSPCPGHGESPACTFPSALPFQMLR